MKASEIVKVGVRAAIKTAMGVIPEIQPLEATQSDAERIVELIDELRDGEGAYVTIYADRVDTKRKRIDVLLRGWCDCNTEHYVGDSLLICLEKAHAAMVARTGKGDTCPACKGQGRIHASYQDQMDEKTSECTTCCGSAKKNEKPNEAPRVE